MNFTDLEAKTTSIRTHVNQVYDEINNCRSTLLPSKDNEFIAMKDKLAKELYDVVVCGEVKKGKSSFINAVIGEPLLPVNTEVATSQVFRIVNSDRELYELVFVDGSRKEISKEDLTKYGSHVAADENGLPVFEQAIDYIEIHYPITFLPKSIAIVDTPGIGAVYADHERITRRYLKNAAAVIFITDPQNPITEPERTFVESALDITNQMVFVMTKMDNYDSEYIVNMVRRDEEILDPMRKRVYNGSVNVMPMSSKILADAANNDDAVLRGLDVISSQFDKVREAVLTMVYTMIGLGDNVVYTNRMIAYNSRVMSVIKEKTEALQDNGKAAKLLTEKQRLQQKFVTQWGPTSANYRDVTQTISDESSSIPNKIAVVCGTSGSVYKRFQCEINALSNVDEAKQYANDLPTRIQEAIERAVRDEIEAVSDNINEKLQQYSTDVQSFVTTSDSVTVGELSINLVDTDAGSVSKSVNGFRMQYFNIAIFTAVGSIFGPVGALVGLVAGVIAGFLMSREEKIRKAKTESSNYLTKAMNAAYTELCVKANPITQSEKVRRDIKSKADSALREIYDNQKHIVDERVTMLSSQIAASVQQKQTQQIEINQLKEEWKPIHSHLTELKNNIESLEKELQVA